MTTTAYPEIPETLNPRRVTWSCALDNYEPVPRREGYGTGTTYDRPDGTRGLRLEGGLGDLREGCALLVDDGETVLPMYSVGHHDGRPSPMYPDGHMPYGLFHVITPLDGWRIGPKMAYHLKVREGGSNV